jgi:hypothetical protein
MENKPELEVPLEEQFRYHPPTTVERKAKHEAINAAALECAKVLCTCVRSAKNQQKLIDAIQNARMLANQYVTFEELSQEHLREKEEMLLLLEEAAAIKQGIPATWQYAILNKMDVGVVIENMGAVILSDLSHDGDMYCANFSVKGRGYFGRWASNGVAGMSLVYFTERAPCAFSILQVAGFKERGDKE